MLHRTWPVPGPDMRLACNLSGIGDSYMHLQLLSSATQRRRSGRAGVLRGLLWIAALQMLTPAASCAAGQSLDLGYAAVLRAADGLSGLDHGWRTRGVAVDRAFDRHVMPQVDALDGLSTQELGVLLRATHVAAVASKQPRYSDIALRIGMQLRAQGAVQPADIRAGALIAMISRDGASLTPSSPWAPAFNGAPMPTLPETRRDFEYWTLAADAASYRTAIADTAALRIVVIAHPACGFTRAVADAARADPELGRMLSGTGALWLSPQDGTLDPRIFTDWGARHPDLPIRIVARQSGFPEFGYWGTPTFYILRDGKVAARVVGWPAGGNKAALHKAFADAGIATGP